MTRKTRDEIAAAIRAAIEAGSIRNADLSDMKHHASSAYSRDRDAMRETLLPTGWQNASEQRRAVYDAMPFEARHLASAARKIPADVWAFIPELERERWSAFVTAWTEIAEGIAKLKPLAVKGRAPSTKLAEPEPDSVCQVCGRRIELVHSVEFGKPVMAHHGYERPGHGTQTASCYAARHPQWSESCDRLRKYIEEIAEPHLARQIEARAALDVPGVRVDSGKQKPTGLKRPVLKRGIWYEVELMVPIYIGPGDRDYSRRLGIVQAIADRDVKDARDHLDAMRKRLASWRPPG